MRLVTRSHWLKIKDLKRDPPSNRRSSPLASLTWQLQYGRNNSPEKSVKCGAG